MRPWMDPELEMLRDTARRFFQKEVVPHEARWRAQHHADREIWAKAGAAGLLCASIPEQYGGGGGSFLHEAVICEEQMTNMAQAFSNNVHSGIVAHYLLAYGNEDQKRRWLPRMATGELVAAIAMSEPGAGTDLQRIKASARRDGSLYRVSGNKTFITNGYHANLVVVAVKTDAAAKAKGISLVVVETDNQPGFRRGELLDKLGQKTLDAVELFFDDAPVPVANLLGAEEGKGFAQLMQQLPQERLLIAVGAVATMTTRWPTCATGRCSASRCSSCRTRGSSWPNARRKRPSRAASSTTASRALAAASSTCRPRQWRSGGPPTPAARSSTSACSCTAATAT
jgi:acyl-CoA dehydrogenase